MKDCKQTIIDGLRAIIENSQITAEELYSTLYTILLFKETLVPGLNNSRIYTLQANGEYHTGARGDTTQTLNQMLRGFYEDGIASVEDRTWYIYQVRRESDQQIFTIGDTIIHSNDRPENSFVIDNFQIGVQNDIWTNPTKEKGTCNIRYWKKVNAPKVLLTTADDVDTIEPGQVLYGVGTNSYNTCEYPAKDIKEHHTAFKWFYDKKKRDKYILNNKLLFSIEELKKMDTVGYNSTTVAIAVSTEKLYKEARKKLQAG